MTTILVRASNTSTDKSANVTSFARTEEEGEFVVSLAVNVCLSAFILSSNALTVATVTANRGLRTQNNLYVVSLAVSDFLSGIFLLLEAVLTLPVSREIVDHFKALCLFKHVLLFVSMCASMITVTLIAVDKWIYLGAPFFYRRTVTVSKVVVVVVICWVTSLLCGLTILFVEDFKEDGGCQIQDILGPTFMFFGYITPVALVFVVTGVCYIGIVRIVLIQRRKIREVNQKSDARTADAFKKSVCLFMIIFGVFVLCWSPFVSQGFVAYLYHQDLNHYRPLLCLALANSGLNFFIYAWKNRDFRTACKRMLFGKCRSVSERSEGLEKM